MGSTPSPDVRRYVTRTLSVSICSALAVALLFLILRRLGFESRLSFFTALLIHFGTLLFPFSTLFYPYGPATLFSVLSFYILLRLGALIDRLSRQTEAPLMFVNTAAKARAIIAWLDGTTVRGCAN